MEWWDGILVVASLCFLRLAVPLGLVALVGYGIRRLDSRWHPVIAAGGGD